MKSKALTLAFLALLLAGLVYAFRNSVRVWWQSRELPGESAGAARSAAATAAPGQRRILYYQDPMHPWYKSDKPGIAPDCGMKLVPVYADEGAAAESAPPGSVRISPTSSSSSESPP